MPRESGSGPATVGGRIAETEPGKASYALVVRREPRPRMTEEEIRAIFDKPADVVCVLDGSPVAHMWRTMIWPNNFL